jgi:hypothetical protein
MLVDTFMGWGETFPCKTEKAREVVRILITEIISRFSLLQSLQSVEVTQGLSQDLGIDYHLHYALAEIFW